MELSRAGSAVRAAEATRVVLLASTHAGRVLRCRRRQSWKRVQGNSQASHGARAAVSGAISECSATSRSYSAEQHALQSVFAVSAMRHRSRHELGLCGSIAARL